MERPVEFDLIARQMHADFLEVNAGLTMRQMAVVLCRGVRTAEQRRIAAAHIATLLSSGLSDAELADMWAATPADCLVKKEHIRAMLVAIEHELSEAGAG
ncbi:MAG TPA: hypothetical protein PKY73_18300 [Hyphomonas sp.]|nr:hypothetical protein [Hyphomonas sp.]